MRLAPLSTRNTDALALSTLNSSVRFEIPEGINRVTYQVVLESSSWPATAVVTVRSSIDGQKYDDFPSGAVTFSSAGLKNTLSVGGLRFLEFVVTAPAGAATDTARIIAEGWSE